MACSGLTASIGPLEQLYGECISLTCSSSPLTPYRTYKALISSFHCMHVLCSMLCFSPHHVHLFLSQFYCMCFGVAQVFFCLVVSIWSCFILSTCPSHQICTVMSFVMFLLLVFKNSYWLFFFFFFGAKRSGQFFCCGKSQVSPYLLTTCQFSEPYRRTDLTLLLYRSIFVLRLYCV